MMRHTAKAHCRIHVGEHCLDHTFSGSRGISLLVALVALALMIAMLPALSLARDWLATRVTGSVPGPVVQIDTPRVPSQPVEGLDRIDLSVVVRNPSQRTIENVSLEMKVLRPDGSIAMFSRQGHVTLQPQDSRAIYWGWRVPAQLPSGEYAVQVRAFDANGRPLGGDELAGTALKIAGRGGD